MQMPDIMCDDNVRARLIGELYKRFVIRIV